MIFESPSAFHPKRFLHRNEQTGADGIVNADMLRPWGIGKFACPGRMIAEKQVLALAAGILAMWDFEPVNGRSWVVPKQEERAAVAIPTVDIRVRVRARHLEA